MARPDEIQTLNEFRPTQFDHAIGDDDLGEWLVCPVIQTRDSGVTERCNFESMRRILDDARADYSVVRRGHWGPGWYKIIVVKPSDANARLILETRNRLAYYPILDEHLHSEMEYEDASEQWENWGRAELARKLEREHNISDAAFDLVRNYAPLPEYEHSGDSDIYIRDLRVEWDRSAVAELIWQCRGYANED